MSKWLREADGSISKKLEKESRSSGRDFGIERDFGCNWRRDIEKSFPNPNFMPLGYEKDALIQGYDNSHYMEKKKKKEGFWGQLPKIGL